MGLLRTDRDLVQQVEQFNKFLPSSLANELRAALVQKSQECNDASLHFNSISLLLTLYCVLSHDVFFVDPWE